MINWAIVKIQFFLAALTLSLLYPYIFKVPACHPEFISGSQTMPRSGDAIKNYGYLLIKDTGHIISGPLHWDTKAWRKFSLYTAEVVQEFGSFPSFGVMGAFYLGGALLDNYKAKAVAMDAFAASLVSAGIITTSLKVITGRSRPEDDEGTYKFQPFGGHRSFPSGHTTQA